MKRFIVFIAAMMIAMGVFGAATLDSGIPTDLEILVTAQKLYDYDVLTVDNLVELDILDRDALRDLDLIMPLNNFAATATPEASMDVTEGYEVGSFWYDVTNDVMYSCIDATTDTAIWFPMAVQTALPLNNYAATEAPNATDSSYNGYSVGSMWVDVTNDDVYICTDDTSLSGSWIDALGTT